MDKSNHSTEPNGINFKNIDFMRVQVQDCWSIWQPCRCMVLNILELFRRGLVITAKIPHEQPFSSRRRHPHGLPLFLRCWWCRGIHRGYIIFHNKGCWILLASGWDPASISLADEDYISCIQYSIINVARWIVCCCNPFNKVLADFYSSCQMERINWTHACHFHSYW